MFKFEKVNSKDYKLIYSKNNEEKEILFTITVEMVKELQGIVKNARLNMFKELTEAGISKDDLIIRKEVNGQIIYDETNYKKYEEEFMMTAQLETIDKVYKKAFNMGIEQLVNELGIANDEKEAFRFSTEFATIVKGEEDPLLKK